MKLDIETDENVEVQMGPMIDCVFLLLIFFIVVAVTKKTIKELDIRLPSSVVTQEVKPKDEDLVIRVTRTGHIYVGSDEVTRQTFRSAVRNKAARDLSAKVLIEADAEARMYFISPLLDELQFSGFKNVCIRANQGGGEVKAGSES